MMLNRIVYDADCKPMVPEGKVVVVRYTTDGRDGFRCLDRDTPGDRLTEEDLQSGEILDHHQAVTVTLGVNGEQKYTLRNNAGLAEVYNSKDELVEKGPWDE